MDCGTQWRYADRVAIGLDYAAVESVMRLHNTRRSDRRDILNRIRLMERVALEEMAKRK